MSREMMLPVNARSRSRKYWRASSGGSHKVSSEDVCGPLKIVEATAKCVGAVCQAGTPDHFAFCVST